MPPPPEISPEAPTDPEQLIAEVRDASAALSEQIGKAIVGQRDVVDQVFIALFTRGHALLVGVPGLAKTLLVSTIAKSLSLEFNRIQFTPDLMPSDITGTEVIEENRTTGHREMRFVKGPVFANLILADEINRTPPKTQAALLEAMQEHHVTAGGVRHPLPEPFFVLATQNPIEQEGTYPLPEAQLDRFMLSLRLDYPDAEEEERIVAQTAAPSDVTPSAVLSLEQLMRYQALTKRVPVSPHVVSYAVALARATRPAGSGRPAGSDVAERYVEWGAGPRAGQHLVRVGRALALLSGEPAVTTAHVRRAAPHVLRHRVLPNYHAAGEGVTAGDVVKQIIESVAE
ncbi:MAG: MoxR family ATPase [Planctomycetota bacterium]